ncbi:LOB domain-containing protein 27-like isoform X2 [Telopea speciosissima]|uniref:LOB domain-containing protein 27-like isoform X2 n=1 Tax=Telopea speciosissima TaxID=54955 RepID=UPI001CC37A7C|nr:LOB domain-containing protein 27-like isoform X2 [Telopea speciosissima]
MTVKGGTSQACAACKYQRRKCAADCPLAPYFPPHEPKTFQNAHRLFGVSNILKILKQLNPNQKNDAMGSIIFQSNMRDRFPVHGCYGIICQLRFQIEQVQQELLAVQAQLAFYQHHHHHHLSSSSPPHHSPSSQLQLGMSTSPPPPQSSNNTLSLFHHNLQPFNAAMPITGISLSPTTNGNNVTNNGYNTAVYMESKDNLLLIQNQNQNPYNSAPNSTISNNNSAVVAANQSPFLVSQGLSILQEPTEAPRDYDEIPPFFDTIDDRQSYIDSKEAYDSSSEDSLKGSTQPIEHVQENELKNAAACFRFATSVN